MTKQPNGLYMCKSDVDLSDLVEALMENSHRVDGAYTHDLLVLAANNLRKLQGNTSEFRHKCIVKGCRSDRRDTPFVGDMCQRCNTMITTGNYGCGGTIFHHAEHERQQLKEALIKIQQEADIGLGDV